MFATVFSVCDWSMRIGYFTVVCSGGEAEGDLVLIQTLLLLICKSFSFFIIIVFAFLTSTCMYDKDALNRFFYFRNGMNTWKSLSAVKRYRQKSRITYRTNLYSYQGR